MIAEQQRQLSHVDIKTYIFFIYSIHTHIYIYIKIVNISACQIIQITGNTSHSNSQYIYMFISILSLIIKMGLSSNGFRTTNPSGVAQPLQCLLWSDWRHWWRSWIVSHAPRPTLGLPFVVWVFIHFVVGRLCLATSRNYLPMC